ncbi:uncharacterized protein LOC142180900 [Nicotiana tabacum]|uniref:Uncharacterized protein LOC142180900 n=2 Tax=Nicotiana tabacum TaxID=4097 RepID=A0AC58UI09_TOBAC
MANEKSVLELQEVPTKQVLKYRPFERATSIIPTEITTTSGHFQCTTTKDSCSTPKTADRLKKRSINGSKRVFKDASFSLMLDASRAGGDFHLRTATNMYPHIHEAVEKAQVLLECHLQPAEEKSSCLICWTFVL